MRIASAATGIAASLLPTLAVSKAILGVDLGSLYMKVALVKRNSPLEIVTNLHSKRKTEQMVLFDAGTRFYGADASSLLGRKPHLTPAAMSVMLGRDQEHPTVQVLAERHYPIVPSYNDTRSGVTLKVDGNDFTPEELVAMVLTHAKDITAAYGAGSEVKDCVLTVPSFYTQHERRALLDAASLASINVLALIDENAAAALHFGIDRIDDEPKRVLFFNMGASALQATVVRYFSYERKESKYGKAKKVGAFEVLGKGWDSTLGGDSFDSLLVNHMADEFNEQWNAKRNDGQSKDVRSNKRAMTKLRLQANKVKHVLSANNDMPVYIDALHDDTSYSSHIGRAKFEEICHGLLQRTAGPIKKAVETAGLTLDDIDLVELVGGGMRVPRVQEEIKSVLGDKLDLGMHINSDESMALGAAFHGANVSTAFRVRHVGMQDVNPFQVSISLSDLDMEEEKRRGLFGFGGGGAKKEEKKSEGDGDDEEEEKRWSKRATIFYSFGKIGVKKTIAFTHDRDVRCAIDYEENEHLPPGTETSIERYNVTGVAKFAREMEEKGLGKPKVSLQFELSTSGITRLVKAEAAVDEIVTVQEEVEVDDDDDEDDDEGGEKKEEEGDGKDEKEEGEKKEGEGEEDASAAEEEERKDAEEERETESSAAKESEDEEETKKEEEDEKKEDDDDDDASGEEKSEKEGDEKKEEDGDDAEPPAEKKEKKKKKKKITVEKEKKKVHKRTLSVDTYHVGRVRPYTPQIMAESVAKLENLARKDKERMMLEESRNKVESYVYYVKNKLIDDEEIIGSVTTETQREEILKLATDAEEWMYEDGYDADLATFEDKYAEISVPAEKIFFRASETSARPTAAEALRKKLDKVEELMKKWETTMTHVTDDERTSVLDKVEEARKRMDEMETEQETTDPTADPVYVSKDVPEMTKPIEVLVAKLAKKPKPKPVAEEKKNETDSDEETKKNETESDEGGEEEEGDEKKERHEEDGAAAADEDKSEAKDEDDGDAAAEEGDDEL